MQCRSCNTELKLVFDNPNHGRRRGDLPQYENALIIDFIGAYGMFLDPLVDGNPRAIICGDCATTLMHNVPWIGKLISEQMDNQCAGDPSHQYHSHDDDPLDPDDPQSVAFGSIGSAD